MLTETDSTGTIERLINEPWRLEPHTFAEEVSEGKWQAWPYLSLIGSRILDAIVGGSGRLIINMPPGHGKSSLLSHWLPTWFLDNQPDKRVILAGHGAELAASFGRTVRNEFERNPRLTTRLSEDSTAADRWNTPEGGGMKTAGVGGGITGFRGDLILVDDPHPTWEAVNSETHRKRVGEWFDGTLRDRAEPGATMVVLMHRWHEEDLVGHLLAHDAAEWDVIRLPALAEEGDILGREVDEPLCPQRYDRTALLATKRAVGSLVWAGKYQQRPSPPEGNYFKRQWFKFIEPDRVPRMRRVVRCWDLAATVDDGTNDPDWLAGAKIGEGEDDRYYVLHLHRDRVSAAGVESAIQQFGRMDGKGVAIRIEQEGAASGKIVKHHFERMMNGWDCKFTGIPRTSKFTRSGPFNATSERGDVVLVQGDWNEPFLDEITKFPNAPHDDQVDASVGGYEELTGGVEPWKADEMQQKFSNFGRWR